MVAIEAVTATGQTAALCQSVGLARATLYRRRQPARALAPRGRAPSSRALAPAERQAVLDLLHSERFVDPLLCDAHVSPLQIVRPYGPDADWYAFAALLMQQGITSPAAIEAIMKQSATDIGATGRDNEYGYGLINPRAALRGMGIAR